ncbi:hypothetical protein BHE74_00005448 [Ensete ventricosum]|nr:hypothetical protein BHE74_00005448 [Ensete ventricosum]
MGTCVSTLNRRPRSRKYSLRSRKCCRKISASVPDAPAPRKNDLPNHFACNQIVHVKTAATTHWKSEVSNLAFHLTQLQWHHSQMERNGMGFLQMASACHASVITQYLLVLIFSVDCLSSINGSIGTQMLQYENASLLVDAVCKFEEHLDTTPIALAVEQHIETDEGKTEKLLSNDECEDADRLEIVNPQGFDIQLEKVDEAKLRNQTESCTKMKKVLGDICGSFKGLKEIRHDTEENFRDSTLKQLSSSCAPHLVPSISFNDKIQQFPTTSPQCQKRRSAVIRVSIKRKSKDGDETTEFCK